MTEEKHIFISYPHEGAGFANTLTQKLETSGFRVWIDKDQLTPGTRDFEQSIRNAIANAFLLVVVATPLTSNSPYVRGEIALAEAKRIPVIMVWAEGENWIDCIPLEFVNAQYIDCRLSTNRLDEGMQKLVQVITQILKKDRAKISFAQDGDISAPFITVKLDATKSVLIDHEGYRSFKDLLDDLYLGYLESIYPAFTYGLNWVLENTSNRYLKPIAVPMEWLDDKYRANALSFFDTNWDSEGFNSNPENYALRPNTKWKIVEPKDLRGVGIVTNDRELVEQLFYVKGAASLTREQYYIRGKGDKYEYFALNTNRFKFAELQDVNVESYNYRYVVNARNMPLLGDRHVGHTRFDWKVVVDKISPDL
ncbi:MAG: TIR domain-containing protein [Anaerolineae bacterium]|nr:TIR domain-containing protein [Anaerolineae bacterium]